MKHEDALILIGILSFMAGTSLVLYFTENDSTANVYGSYPPFKSAAKAPFTDLPYNNQPIEMPFAGRCYRDEGDQVVYFTVTTPDVERAFDGCYKASDGNYYYYDYYCVGTPKLSQVWLRISPNCKEQQ